MEELDSLSNPGTPYPYEMIWRMNAIRVNSFNHKFRVKCKDSQEDFVIS